VGCADATSRNNNRLDGISRLLKILTDSVDDKSLLFGLDDLMILTLESGLLFHRSDLTGEYHRGDSNNILTNNPSGSHRLYDAKHCRPEVTVVCRSLSLSGQGEGLAGESSGKNCNPVSVF